MQKIIFLFLILTLNIATIHPDSTTKLLDTVYVCGQSGIYHPSKYHSALGRCKHKIYTMTEAEAIRIGKRHCRCRN